MYNSAQTGFTALITIILMMMLTTILYLNVVLENTSESQGTPLLP